MCEFDFGLFRTFLSFMSALRFLCLRLSIFLFQRIDKQLVLTLLEDSLFLINFARVPCELCPRHRTHQVGYLSLWTMRL